jgi:hypothetical protein
MGREVGAQWIWVEVLAWLETGGCEVAAKVEETARVPGAGELVWM